MEKIGQFLTFCDELGVPKSDIFQTVDLYEGQNIPQVCHLNCEVFMWNMELSYVISEQLTIYNCINVCLFFFSLGHQWTACFCAEGRPRIPLLLLS